jgi:hypothetical protein
MICIMERDPFGLKPESLQGLIAAFATKSPAAADAGFLPPGPDIFGAPGL